MRRFITKAFAVVWCLLPASGCGGPAFFQVETVIRPDGSCDRLIWQPKGEMLPEGALTPGWAALWNGVADVAAPPAFTSSGPSHPDRAYFHAHGDFASPDEIPPHFLHRNPHYPDVGASELTRSYERKDLGFLVEHRWVERITNIVTRDSFLNSRNEFLEIALPLFCEGIERVYGERYDVSAAVIDVRTRGRRLLDDAACAYFEALSNHEGEHEMGVRFAGVFQRLGVEMFDAKGAVASMEEATRRIQQFAHDAIVKDVKRRDSRPLSEDEIKAILESYSTPPYSDAWSAFLKEHETELKTRLGPLLLRMTGLYSFPPVFPRPTPQFAFAVRLPGRIVEEESNGAIADSGQVRWNFDGSRIFPEGYEMKAVSVDLAEETQRRLLGRVVIADVATARAFREMVGDEGILYDLVRRACREGDVGILRGAQGENDLQRAQIDELKRFLGLATP